MNHYEAVFILDPRLDDERLAALKAELKGKIDATGAQDAAELKCDRRTLTFPIRKLNEGFYLIFRFKGPGDSVGKLRTELRHTESILRMSYVRIPESVAVQPVPQPAAAPAPAPSAPAAVEAPAVAPEPAPVPEPAPTGPAPE